MNTTHTHGGLDALELEELREAYAASAATVARLRKERDFARWALATVVDRMRQRDPQATKLILVEIVHIARERGNPHHGR